MKKGIFGKRNGGQAPSTNPNLIVMVEDELDICEIVGHAFRSRGYQFKAAHDGQAGLDMIRSMRPALVLLDIQLPVMNGYQVLAVMQQDPGLADIPVFVMTSMDAEHQFSEKEWAARLKISRFISKPYDAEAVVLLVDRALRPSTIDADPSA